MAAEYMEEIPMVVPALLEPHRHGDLWNCRSSEFVSENIFGKGEGWGGELAPTHFALYPKKEMSYTLSHSKNTMTKLTSVEVNINATMTINILGAKITLNIGRAKFRNDIENKVEAEELEVHYQQETWVVRLLPSANTLADPAVIEKLETLGATHVLTEVVLGAELLTTVRITEEKTTEFESKTASGLGVLIAGPLSAAVKAGLSALLGGKGDSVDVQFNLESNIQPAPEEPQTIETVLALVERIEELIAGGERPYPQLGDHVTGWPVRYFLLPISHFVKDGPPLSRRYRILEAALQEEYVEVMSALKDYSQVGFLRSHICHMEPRLKQILLDEWSELFGAVKRKEEEVMRAALKYYEDFKATFEEYKEGAKDMLDLRNLIDRAKEELRFEEIEGQVGEWVAQGREWLSKLMGLDVKEELGAIFQTSKDRIDAWKSAGLIPSLPNGRRRWKEQPVLDAPLRLLLNMGNVEAEVVGGALSRVYELSQSLQWGTVSVTYPDADRSESTFFLELSLHTNGEGSPEWGRYTDPKAIILTLDILLVMTGKAPPVLSALCAFLTASHFGGLDVTRCLEEQNKLLLPEVIRTLREKCEGIHVFENFVSLRDALQEEGEVAEAGKLKLVATLEATESAVDSASNFFALRSILSEEATIWGDLEWLIGSFGVSRETKDAPLLFVFFGAELVATCFHALDMALLTRILRAGNPLPLLLPTLRSHFFDGRSAHHLHRSFFPARAQFAIEAVRLLNPNFVQASSAQLAVLRTYPLPPHEEQDAGGQIAIDNALMIASSVVTPSQAQPALVSSLTAVISNSLQSDSSERAQEAFNAVLRSHNWSHVTHEFPSTQLENPEWIRAYSSSLWTFVWCNGSELLRLIGLAFTTLHACIQDLQNEIEEDRLHVPSSQLDAVVNHEDCDAGVKAEIQRIRDEEGPEDVQKYEQILPLLETATQLEFDRHERPTNILLLIDLLQLIDAENQKDEEEEEAGKEGMNPRQIRFERRRRRRLEFVEFKERLLVHFILREEAGIPWGSESVREAVEALVHGGLYGHVVHRLSLIKYPPFHQLLFTALDSSPDGSLLPVLNAMLEFEASALHFCWRNNGWEALLTLSLQDTQIVKTLIENFCTVEIIDGAPVVKYPPFFNRPVLAAIEEYLGSGGGEDNPGEGDGEEVEWWDILEDVLDAFQSFYVEHHYDDLQTDPLLHHSFYSILRRQVRHLAHTHNLSLLGEIREAGLFVLLGWRETEQRVLEPLLPPRLLEAIDVISECLRRRETAGPKTPPHFSLKRREGARDGEALLCQLLKLEQTPLDSIRTIMDSLILQRFRRSGGVTEREFWAAWEGNQVYATVLKTFAQIFQMRETKARNEILYKIEAELSGWSSRLGAPARRTLASLRQKLASCLLQEDGAGKTVKLRRLVKVAEEELRSVDLQLAHIFYEFQQLLTLFPQGRGGHSGLVSGFVKCLEDYFLGGQGHHGSIQTFRDPLQTQLNEVLLSLAQNEPKERGGVFVLSLIGMAGGENGKALQLLHEAISGLDQSEARKGTRAPKVFSVGGSTGVTLHRIERRKDEGVVYLLQTEDCVGSLPEHFPEGGDEEGSEWRGREAGLISFVMSISHLTLVHYEPRGQGERLRAELRHIVGRSLVDMCRIGRETAFGTDVLFVTESPPEEEDVVGVNAWMEQMLESAEVCGSELGLVVAPLETMERISSRIQRLRSMVQLSSESLLPEIHPDSSWSDWVKMVLQHWASSKLLYKGTEAVVETRFDCVERLQMSLAARKSLWSVHGVLGVCFARHTAACEKLMQEEFARWGAEEVGWGEYEGLRNQLLNRIQRHLASIPSECEGTDVSSGTSEAELASSRCDACTAALEEIGGLEPIKNDAELRRVTLNLFGAIWLKIQQMALASEIKLFKGVGPPFDEVFEKCVESRDEEPEKIVQLVREELGWWWGDQVKVPLFTSALNAEVPKVYATHVWTSKEFSEWLAQCEDGQTSPRWPPSSLSPYQVEYKLKYMIDDRVALHTRPDPASASDCGCGGGGEEKGQKTTASLYQPGLLLQLRLGVEAELERFSRLDPLRDFGLEPGKEGVVMEVDLQLKTRIHSYALRLFFKHMAEVEGEWRREFDLLTVIHHRSHQEAIAEEVLKRLAGA